MAQAIVVTQWLILLGSAGAAAQTTTQLWTNITLGWTGSETVSYEVDFEPKVLVSAPPDAPGWRGLDVTPAVELAVKRWFDLTGEFVAGYTVQTDDLRTTELSLRAGVRFHVLEDPAKSRLVIRNWIRVDGRRFFYSNDDPDESAGRVRNRVELLLPLNRPRLTDDGVVSTLADWEWFIPWTDPSERFASRQRVRFGASYRRSRAWTWVAFYTRNRSRNTTGEPFSTDENVVNVQIRRKW